MFLSFGAPCSKCDCKDLRHSRVRPVDWPMVLIGLIPSRCINCNARSYRRRRAVAPVNSKPAPSS